MIRLARSAVFLFCLAILFTTSAASARDWEDMPQVRVRILDKITGRTRTYDLDVGRTVAYAKLRIRPKSCRKTSPLDEPDNASFLQIWEVKPDESTAWVFSGWMFSSSPSLSAMDHPVYDVWIIDCINPSTAAQSETPDQTEDGDAASGDQPDDSGPSPVAPAAASDPIPEEEVPTDTDIESAPANDTGDATAE